MLILLYLKANLNSVSLTAILAIDVALYAIFFVIKQLFQGWSYFGFIANFDCIKLNSINLIQKITLRIISALCILVIVSTYSQYYLSILPYNTHILNYVAIPFLTYRSFKRCLS